MSVRFKIWLLTLAAAILLPALARAHAILEESDPPAGASVKAGPVDLRFRYNSRIDQGRSRLTLIRPDQTHRHHRHRARRAARHPRFARGTGTRRLYHPLAGAGGGRAHHPRRRPAHRDGALSGGIAGRSVRLPVDRRPRADDPVAIHGVGRRAVPGVPRPSFGAKARPSGTADRGWDGAGGWICGGCPAGVGGRHGRIASRGAGGHRRASAAPGADRRIRRRRPRQDSRRRRHRLRAARLARTRAGAAAAGARPDRARRRYLDHPRRRPPGQPGRVAGGGGTAPARRGDLDRRHPVFPAGSGRCARRDRAPAGRIPVLPHVDGRCRLHPGQRHHHERAVYRRLAGASTAPRSASWSAPRSPCS